jgi:hypothetical protein
MLLYVKIFIAFLITIIIGTIVIVKHYSVKSGKSSSDDKECVSECDQKNCGDDGCGGDCGLCINLDKCLNGKCCTPKCDQKNCGDDGCGGSCGACSKEQTCVNGVCCPGIGGETCKGRECGDDGCGGSCGACSKKQKCLNGVCCPGIGGETCKGRECGDDVCGNSCGTCSGTKNICHNNTCIECSSGTCGKNAICYNANKQNSKCVCNLGFIINPETKDCTYKPRIILWTELNYTGIKKIIDVSTPDIDIATGKSINSVISSEKPAMQYKSLELLTGVDKSVSLPITIRFTRSGKGLLKTCYDVKYSDLSSLDFKIPDLQNYIITNPALNNNLRFFDPTTLFEYYQNQVFSLQLVQTINDYTACIQSSAPAKPHYNDPQNIFFVLLYKEENYIGEFILFTHTNASQDITFSISNSTMVSMISISLTINHILYFKSLTFLYVKTLLRLRGFSPVL